MKNVRINFINRLAIQSIVSMMLSEWFFHQSYDWCDIAPLLIGVLFVLQLIVDGVKFLRRFSFKVSRKED